ncbi:uncharacterized protein MELLADRAFT_86698 [Melampsora larici-populina 98AG31]|uniref:Uncharacterized protein n=1 Tax=Melampsora larici-populina (strain 98AG31 / pathotype 3-4-7) TaxID=747676 RepID=F4R326_MELLP|nr:uncharacterized protein MELLADRAFT_86698 [Melampsora larici-populina 98AG31]EGG13242.1 hypothetical protein MELLADRAFT_86698 [Melampsora larici-populina 98AG31]
MVAEEIFYGANAYIRAPYDRWLVALHEPLHIFCRSKVSLTLSTSSSLTFAAMDRDFILRRLPMRWSSICWVGDKFDGPPYAHVAQRYFETNTVLKHENFESFRFLLAEGISETVLKSRHAYRIEGPVIMTAARSDTVLLVNPNNTIFIDDAEVRVKSLANKISVTSVGRIIDSARRVTPAGVFDGVTITTIHRDWDPTTLTWIEFRIIYECNLEVTWLNRHALKRDNVVQFVGNVIHGDAHEAQWVVNSTLTRAAGKTMCSI